MSTAAQTEVEHKGIASVLKDSLVRVPIHQRPFSWQREQVEELLDDLHGAHTRNEEHFLGTLVLVKGKRSQEFEVLDGQQRLAVVAILMSAIADRFAALGDSDRATAVRRDYLASTDIETGEPTSHLSLSSDDELFFRDLLNATGELTPKSDSNKRLQEAKNTIHAWLENNQSSDHAVDWLAKLYVYLRDSARVIVLKVHDDANAFLIFETLNDRGLDLSIADLLKNYLLGLAKDDLPIALNSWTNATSALKAYGGENLFSVFLRHYWSSRYSVIREKALYHDIKSRIASRANAVELADQLDRHSSLYAAIISPEHEYWATATPAARSTIRTLRLLGLEQYRPLLLAAMAHFNAHNIESLLSILVSWNVRLLIVGGLGGGVLERQYSELAQAIRSGAYKSSKDIARQSKTFIPNDTLFQTTFADARVSNVTLARYYLRELELYMRTKAGVSQELQPAEDLTLEHIYPDKPASGWNTFSDDDSKAYRPRIGNLTLLTRRLNSSLRNGPFNAKRKAYADSALLITQDVSVYADWSPSSVDARQNKLAAVVPLVWPLSGVNP